MTLSPNQRAALCAIADVLVPRLSLPQDCNGFYARAASDVELDTIIADALDKLAPWQQRDFIRLLGVLSSPLAGMTAMQVPKSVQKMSSEEIEQLLQLWSKSPVGLLRQGFQALKKIIMFLYYGYSDEAIPNPSWQAIGYPGPLPLDTAIAQSSPARPILPLDICSNTTLSCDVVIVGSGAGGGVMAGELSAAGFDVIIVEKGQYYDGQDFSQREATMIGELYEAGGGYGTTNGSVSIFAGACLGGGTTINWTAALRTPEYVLEEWATNHGNPHFLTAEYQRSFDAVEATTHVDTMESAHNLQNQALVRGANALGYSTSIIPRNANGCSGDGYATCGYCSLGCRRGTKMSVVKTYLQQAFERGARFLVNAEAERIIVERGTAKGVEVRMTQRSYSVRINAKLIVVAAGALHTPALLRRSGLSHDHIGKHLHLHPTVAVAGIYPEQMNPWQGNMMTALCNDFAQCTGNWGFKLETPPIHSGLLAMALPWTSGKAHKDAMLKAAHVGAFIVLTRDRGAGRITIDKRGNPLAHYTISDFDLAHLQRGILEAARIHAEAGATELYLPHQHYSHLPLTNGRASAESLLSAMTAWKWRANDAALFSAHQMGTCRMGGNRATHPISPEGECYEVNNLFVSDASAFPEASGANPMISIQAMAHFIAQGIKVRFRS